MVALETVQSMLESHAESSARFLRYALSDYVQSHSLLRWCPGPDCTIVFYASQLQAKKVSCSKCTTTCWLAGMATLYPTRYQRLHAVGGSILMFINDHSLLCSFSCGEVYHCPTGMCMSVCVCVCISISSIAVLVLGHHVQTVNPSGHG